MGAHFIMGSGEFKLENARQCRQLITFNLVGLLQPVGPNAQMNYFPSWIFGLGNFGSGYLGNNKLRNSMHRKFAF